MWLLLQVLTAMLWGLLADEHGTKTLIQISQVSAAGANLALAFAPNFAVAVGTRFIAGLLNSITGAMKTNVAQSFHIKHQVCAQICHPGPHSMLRCAIPTAVERRCATFHHTEMYEALQQLLLPGSQVAHKTLSSKGARVSRTQGWRAVQPHVFGLTMSCWAIGSIIGPCLGGIVAEPCANWKALRASRLCSAPDTFLRKYPFAIPYSGAALLCVLGVLAALFFLHPEQAVRAAWPWDGEAAAPPQELSAEASRAEHAWHEGEVPVRSSGPRAYASAACECTRLQDSMRC